MPTQGRGCINCAMPHSGHHAAAQDSKDIATARCSCFQWEEQSTEISPRPHFSCKKCGDTRKGMSALLSSWKRINQTPGDTREGWGWDGGQGGVMTYLCTVLTWNYANVPHTKWMNEWECINETNKNWKGNPTTKCKQKQINQTVFQVNNIPRVERGGKN